jgi:septal ring factor EnvC (AmiA/AmiB activator)
VDPESYNRLEAALLAAAPKGFRALLTSLDTLRKAIPDEGTLYKAVLAILGPQGHSVPGLVIDLEQCVKLLEAQRVAFMEEIARQTEARVGARKRELDQMDTEVARLRSEIDALGAKRTDVVKTIEADSAQIEAVRGGFEGAYQAKHAQLLDQKNKLATYGRDS